MMTDDLASWLLLGTAMLSALWIAFAIWTLRVAHRYGGSSGRWFVYGMLLGPIGVLLSYRMVRPCPSCDTIVLRDVRVCPSCGKDVPRLQPGENAEDYLKTYRKTW